MQHRLPTTRLRLSRQHRQRLHLLHLRPSRRLLKPQTLLPWPFHLQQPLPRRSQVLLLPLLLLSLLRRPRL
jgi:hypothetical protein